MPTMPLVGDELAGYRLMGVVGRGGMSIVYRAENPRLGSTVALKVLAPEIATNDLFRTRFLQESRIAASLSHPNVIPIYDMGSHADLLYIAMRYVNGHDMRDLLKAKRPLPSTEALYLVGQCGRALDYAHRHSLVHRDVKPANVLVEAGVDDEDPEHVFLADFGITKHALSRTGLTPTGQFMGTLDYVAPEQIQGKEVGRSADIYSLGCVLYEGLTGQVPFVKEIDAAVLWAHVEEPAPAPSSINPALPARIDAVMARALSKNPGDRYTTCHEMVAAARSAFERDEQPTALSRPVASQRHPPVEETADPAARLDADLGARPGDSLGGSPVPVRGNGAPVAAAAAPPPAAAPASVPSSEERTPAGALDRAAPGSSLPLQPPAGAEDSGSAAPAPDASGPRHRSEQHDQPDGPDQLDGPGGPDGPGAPGVPPPGGGGPGIGGLPRRAGLVVVGVSALVLAVLGGIWYGTQQREQPADSTPPGAQHSSSVMGTASAGMSDSMSPAPSSNQLAEAIALANTSTGGMLPADRCSVTGTDQVACDQPHVGIGQARFRTYPSLHVLYAAYAQRVRGLSDDRLPVNVGDCTRAKISGEVSWNHNFVHPRHYTMAQVASGTLRDDTQAAGRVFCRLRDGVITIVWTDNHAKMLGTVTGAPHSLVFRWWKHVHHDLAVGDMTDMGH